MLQTRAMSGIAARCSLSNHLCLDKLVACLSAMSSLWLTNTFMILLLFSGWQET